MSDREPDHPDTDPSDGASPFPESDEALLAAAREAHEDRGSSILSHAKLPAPRSIGRYRIVSTLGEGGMGCVYEAEQQNPQRPVALKVVRGGRFVDEHYVRLFHREAQTLARLRHPGIAAIYESGHTEDGQHFFAMELVRGMPLNQYVRTHRLTQRTRLDLFRKICEAINYAHQRGVIHRDLKPSNILIDTEGNPKVLDFGLAKMTDSDIAVATIVTELGQIQGTLPYMSPEQARGNPDEIDLRSDVYSLGVILFELETERLPHQVEKSILHEAVRTICEEQPPKPSSIKRSLRGDLETIILKALEKEPSRRYHSAAALADDIERFLTTQPILARPPSTVYQFRKLVARHKAPFAFLTILFVVILGFGIWNRALYVAERIQRTKADENAETAGRVVDFLVGLFASPDPDKARGRKISAEEILENGTKKIREDLRNEPAIQSKLMVTMGRVNQHLGKYAEATDLLEPALRIRRGLHGEEHLDVAESLHELGKATKARANYSDARAYLEESLAIRRRLLGNNDPKVAKTLLVLGATLSDLEEYVQARELFREALTIHRGAFEEEHVDTAESLLRLGRVLWDLGQYEEAEPMIREGLAMRDRLLPLDDPQIPYTVQLLASVLRAKGDYIGAGLQQQRAASLYRQIYGENHQYFAGALVWQAAIQLDRRDTDSAEPLLLQALAIYSARVDANHAHMASVLKTLGQCDYEKGDYAEAEGRFGEAMKIYDVRGETGDKRAAEAKVGLALVKLALGSSASAQGLLEEALAVYRQRLPQGHWSIAFAESALGGCLVAQQRYRDAEPLLERGYRRMSELRGSRDRYALQACQRLLDLYAAWDKPDKADEYRILLDGGD